MFDLLIVVIFYFIPYKYLYSKIINFFLFDTFFILTIQSFFQVILINPSLIMVLHNYQYIFRDVYNAVQVILKNITNYNAIT